MKKEASDNSIAYMIGVCALLVLCFALAWMYSRSRQEPAVNVAFARVGPISMQAKEFTMRTSLALQSRPEDGEEIEKNRKTLMVLLESTLANADPATLSSPDARKFEMLQKQLTDAVKEKYPRIKVERVWITDFVTSAE